MANKPKILIVDDDANIAELISLYLTKECFDTRTAQDEKEAMQYFVDWQPNLILLDIMLPGVDGYEILRNVRKASNTPVIMLSAKGETFDKVLGLELGADDYIVKPFDSKEMVARVKAVLRRFAASTPDPLNGVLSSSTDFVTYNDIVINATDYSVYYKNKRVEMPPKELELFYYLASHPNHVFTREQLLDQIWSYDYAGDTRTVDVHIKRIREKSTDHPDWDLATVWGIGYKFDYHPQN